MSHFAKKLIVLSAVFVLAVSGYFIWGQKSDAPNTFYTMIEDANLPVIYMEMYGQEINGLHGCMAESGQASRAALTVLPEDRKLGIRIRGNRSQVTELQYEVRNLERDRLLERTEVSGWTQEDGYVRAELPIENLLEKETEYLLTIELNLEGQDTIRYYTRILWTENPYAEQMVALAQEFSAKTFDYNEAASLTTYLESNPSADNSSLGKVTLKSSFSQLVWANLEMQPVGPAAVTVKEIQGIMGNIQLDYMVTRTPEEGPQELYEVSENFTMKWSPQRIYMMDYDRRMNQIFDGDAGLFSGKRIMLGIQDGEELQAAEDAAGAYQAFVVGRELWCLDRQEERAVKVFTFRDGGTDLNQSNYKNHGIRILSVSEAGDIDFLVYGYMNRGNHEGTSGVAMYRYENGDNVIVEKFFVPVYLPYEIIKEDLNTLSFISPENVVYMYLGDTVFSVDLTNNQTQVVAGNIRKEDLAVSEDGRRLAWIEGEGQNLIKLMDLNAGRTDEIRCGQGDILKVLGFVGSDFVYGLASADSEIVENGRVTGTAMYALEIVSETMEVETRYEKQGLYLTDVQISDSRIHMKRLAKTGDGYRGVDEDTLVCNAEIEDAAMSGIGWYASEERRKVYFVQVVQELEEGDRIRLSMPKKMVAEENNTLDIQVNDIPEKHGFLAYGGGRLKGFSTEFAEAVKAAYGAMGIVTDMNGRVLWNRVNRGNIRNLGDVQASAAAYAAILDDFTGTETAEDGSLVLDCRGLSVSQILYFVDQGHPVAAYAEGGSYLLIYGFDQFNISLYDPYTGETFKMGLNDSEAYFSGFGNDFICAL